MLVLEERDATPGPAALIKLGLTTREAELHEKSRFLADVEKSRTDLQATLQSTRQMFEMQVTSLEGDKGEVEEQLAQQVAENGALSASLSDASTRIEELMVRSRQLEGFLEDKWWRGHTPHRNSEPQRQKR